VDENKIADSVLCLSNPQHPGCVMLQMMRGEECIGIGVLNFEALPGFIDSIVSSANQYAEKRLQGVYGGDLDSNFADGEAGSC
jgi:hypothetical protein